MAAKRETYLDMAKGIGIILVVAGHLYGALANFDSATFNFLSPAYEYLSSFHLQLFFFVSGITISLTNEENRNMSDIFFRKFRSIMIPYFAAVIVSSVILVYSYFHYGNVDGFFIKRFIVYSVTLRGQSVMWFLPAMFFGQLIFLFAGKHMSFKGMALFLTVTTLPLMILAEPFVDYNRWDETWGMMLFSCLARVVIRSFVAALFLLIGYAWHRSRFSGLSKVWCFVIGLAFLGINAFCGHLNGTVDINFTCFHNIFLFIFNACTGAFGVIYVCKSLPNLRPLTFLGVNSLVIMITHMDFGILNHAIQVAYAINIYVTRARLYILVMNIIIYILVAELIYVFLFDRFFYILLGRKNPKK